MHNAIYTINRSGTNSCIKIQIIDQMIKLVKKDLTISFHRSKISIMVVWKFRITKLFYNNVLIFILNKYLIFISDATVWKFESRFGFRFFFIPKPQFRFSKKEKKKFVVEN